jgi:predicted methyltransferase
MSPRNGLFPTIGLVVLSLWIPAIGWAQTPANVAAAIAAPDRTKADTDKDVDRKPADLLVFAGVKPGQRIADIMPGQGYFTRIFSHAAGSEGRVYALIPSELAQVAPKLADSAKALGADPALANVTVSIAPTASLSAPEPIDLAWTSDNYHDLYAFFGPDKAAQFDAAVFRMLKPGGAFIVIDHAAVPGADPATIKSLHRIDPALVKAQLLATGFVLEAESPILRNPADAHDLPVFSPSIRGRTDQFVLKFRKPR